jgi:hypothetical protein
MTIELFTQLDDEWTWVARSRRSTDAVRAWRHGHPLLDPFTDVGDIVDFVQRRHLGEPNDRIHAILVGLAPHDDLATRTMLQSVMPGLKALTMTYRTAGDGLDDVASTVVAAAVSRIRTYPCSRRPRRIAANVLLDTRQAVSRSLCRPAVPVVPLIDAFARAAERATERDAVHELRLVLDEAVRRGIVTGEDRRLIEITRLGGVSIAELARSTSAAARLRQRRKRAEASLHASWAPVI